MGAYRDTFLLEKTLEIKLLNNSKIFIETGTADGDSMTILHPHFSELYSCEFTQKGYELSQRNTMHCKNVYIYKDDSKNFLEKMCEAFYGRTDLIFFLDAHSIDCCPLLDELDVILKYGFECPIIIHDFYVPDENGKAKFNYDTFPSLGVSITMDYVKNNIDKIFKNSYNVYMPNKTIEPPGYAIFTKK
jgi:hypothetical protein